MRRLLLTLLLALGAAPAAVPAAAQDTTTAVRPADVIRLSVWRQAEFTGEFPIAQDGTILHPLLSTVRVVGRTREEVRAQLREVLLQYERDPQFVFDYLYRVGVTGEVRLPNLYTLPPETTIAQAVAAAGGVAEFGRLDVVRLMRGGREVILDLRDPSPEVAEMRIRSGDQIRVTRRGASWRDFVGLGASIIAAVASVVGAITVIQGS
jgi:polysaccharide export outer membrane protein